MNKNLSDDDLLLKYQTRWNNIDILSIKQREPEIKIEYKCAGCKRNFIVDITKIYSIRDSLGLCQNCKTVKKNKVISKELGQTQSEIKDFLESLYFKDDSLFQQKPELKFRIMKIFQAGLISRLELRMLYNEWFNTDYSTKKIVERTGLIFPIFINNESRVGKSDGQKYYPLVGYIKRSRKNKSPMMINQSMDNFTITEVGPDERFNTGNLKYESMLNELEIFLKDDTFQTLLKDKLSTIIAEKYATEIFDNDFKIKD